VSGGLLLALAFAAGCALPSDEPLDEEDVSVTEAAVYANRDLLWPSPTGRIDIDVCWVNPGSAPGTTAAARAAWRDARRRAVEESWGRNARINFYGWDGTDPVNTPSQCASSTSTGVHITICTLPTDSRCPALPASQGVILSMTSAGSVASVRSNPNHGPSIMVHEIGHTLGLYHEEERPDAPNIATGPCAKQSFPNADPVLYGAYDDHSIMSYCHPPTAAPWLSANDVAGIQRAYARRLPGSLVTPRGNCAAARHAVGPGDRAFTWDCDEANRDQRWNDSAATATSNGDAFSLYITGVTDPTQYCLAATGAAAGAAVQLAACSTSNDWRLESMFLRGFGSRCLDLQAGNTTVGTPIQMWTCGALGGANQRWSRTRAGQIRYGTTNRCARIGASGRLELGTCSTADPAQLFAFSASRIQPQSNTNLCLDVIGPSDAQLTSGQGLLGDGAQIQLMPCDVPTLNQKWHFSGGLRYDANPSLCLARGSDGNGSALSLGSCTGADETQTWDYYF
jgi:hypothetical protein